MTQMPTRMSRSHQLMSKQTGDAWESTARDRPLSEGLHLIAASVRKHGGEIDLIVREDNAIVFVRVRYRHSAQFGSAAANMARSKQHKLLQTTRLWLARHNGSFDIVDCRFDVLAFTRNNVEWFKSTFSDHSQLRIQSLVLRDQHVRQN